MGFINYAAFCCNKIQWGNKSLALFGESAVLFVVKVLGACPVFHHPFVNYPRQWMLKLLFSDILMPSFLATPLTSPLCLFLFFTTTSYQFPLFLSIRWTTGVVFLSFELMSEWQFFYCFSTDTCSTGEVSETVSPVLFSKRWKLL